MDRQLNLYSDKALTEYTPFKQFTQQDFEQIKKIREVRNFNRLEFNELTSKMYEFQQNKELSGQQHEKVVQSESKMSELVWNRATDSYRMYLFKQGNSQKKLEVEFCSPNITKLLLNTGWFEYEVASILAKWKYAKEIRLGCRFSTKETKDDKNEVDIIINTGTKLLFVECKTYIKNITDIDKFRSVVRNYGGLNSKAIFITDETIDLKAKEKLDDNRLMSFSLKDNHLNLPLEKALFLLLESELNQINPR
jgi:cystathionine beta-lyase/cystathionine gamma-synthase